MNRRPLLPLCALLVVGLAACGGTANTFAHPLNTGLSQAPPAAPPATTATTTTITSTVTLAPPVAPAACGSAAVSLCDDFEDVTPGNPPDANRWTVQITDANDLIEVTAAQAAQGSQALHVHVTEAGFQRAVIGPRSMFPLALDGFFGRTWVMIPAPSPADPVTLFAAGGTLNSGANVWINGGTQGSGLQLTYVGNGQSVSAPVGLSAGVWACLEWQYAGASQEVRVWLDAVEMPTLQVSANPAWTAPTFDRVQIGWERAASPGETRDVYFDSVAFGSTRLGCAP